MNVLVEIFEGAFFGAAVFLFAYWRGRQHGYWNGRDDQRRESSHVS